MLTEARVILPGAQAIFGFQLSVVLTQAFEKLPDISRIAHALSIGFVALAVVLLMTPAAYHRLVYAGEDNEEMHRTGSLLLTLATMPLACVFRAKSAADSGMKSATDSDLISAFPI